MSATLCALVLGLGCTAAHAGARDEVIAAFMKAFEASRYRLTVRDLRDEGGEAVIDVILPDRFHLRSPEGEFIVHPDGSWMRRGGAWQRVPMDMSYLIEAYRQPSREEAEASIGEVVLVGEEVVDGCAARTYRYRSDNEAFGSGSRGEEVLLSVCIRTGLPIRMKPTLQPGSLHYDFEADIDIRPPG